MNDSVECQCGALTAMGNLAKPDCDPIFFVGGSYKHGHVKFSNTPGKNEAEERCLWCGKLWPENLRAAIKKLMEKRK